MNGAESLRTCCNVKSVLDNRFGLCLANKLFSVGDWDFSRISGAVRLVRGQGTRAEQSTLKAIQARFDPDRYLPNRSQHKRTSSYIPFGGGHHRCPGMRFGLLQVKTILTVLLQRYHLDLDETDVAPDFRGLVVLPRQPCRIRYRRLPARRTSKGRGL
jgi:hypothetical protein